MLRGRGIAWFVSHASKPVRTKAYGGLSESSSLASEKGDWATQSRVRAVSDDPMPESTKRAVGFQR
jgi:hypothetical protein